MMLFQFPPAIQAGITAGIYEQVRTATGVPLSIARDPATGQFVGHAVSILSNGAALNPLTAIPQMAMNAGQMYQLHRGFQGVQASVRTLQATVGTLQATTAVIGVGVVASVALSAVNLYHTLKLKKAVERLELKVDNGFLDLQQALGVQGAEVKQLIEQVEKDIKFEQHRLVLIRAYGLFTQALHRLCSAANLHDSNRRNAEIDAARGMLFEALADYINPQLLEETGAVGKLRRLECAWTIEQTIILTYQMQNELAAVSDRLCHLQAKIRQDALTVLEYWEYAEELDFLFPELTRIHNHDLAVLNSWQNHIEWARSLPSSELQLLQSTELKTPPSPNTDATVSALPPEQLLYEKLKQKSHPASVHHQLILMMKPSSRQEFESYVSQQAVSVGYKTLVPSNLQKVSNLAIANLYWYFKVRDETEEQA